MMYWSIRYPLNFRAVKISGKIRHIHALSITLAVILPLPAALIHLKGGFLITANPALICAGRNTDYTYFTFILPMSVVLAMATCIMMLIVWTVFKVSN